MLGCTMDNEKQLETRENVTLSQSGPDQTRRRLTGSALGVSAIFTLASSPVLAGGQCIKPSGFASGNLSGHGTPPTCYGKPPEYWCQQSVQWPSFCKKGQAFHDIPFRKNGCGTTFYKYDSYKKQYTTTVKSCYEVTQPIPSYCSNRDLYDLGRYCTAACLSISENPNSIPCMTTGDVMSIWQDCTTNGKYEVTANTYWSIAQCRDYIKTMCS
jgi:hypothetical protein